MANWNTNTKHSASSINNGNRYEIQDRVTLEQLNAITENSFYASEKVDTVISDAQDVVTQGKTEIENTTSQGKNELNAIVDDAEDLVDKANASINTVVGTANEALFTVQQVVASKGYYGSNPNLLINGDFRVNQRGQPSYSGSEIYSVDRWKHGAYFSKTTINNKVTFSISETTTAANRIAIMQTIEDYKECAGKIVTLSIKVDSLTEDVSNSIRLYMYDGVSSSFTNITGVGVFTLTKMIDMSPTQLTVGIQGTGSALNYSIVPEYMKLEIGSVATAFSPRPYAEELAMCQRYYLPLMNGASVYNGFILTETNARISIPVPTTMRLRTPTAEFKVDDITQCKIYSNGAQVTPTVLNYAGFVDSDQFVINATIPNLTPNHACAMRLLGFASLDAEIY